MTKDALVKRAAVIMTCLFNVLMIFMLFYEITVSHGKYFLLSCQNNFLQVVTKSSDL